MAMHVMQAGLRTHTYPEVLFKATNMTAGGSSCNPDAAPTSRHISFGSASNVLGDPEEACTQAASICNKCLPTFSPILAADDHAIRLLHDR
jgi:hypothetical protein